ncbi:40S ribosomal protein S25 [Staphylotrichum longicolle]|uniref:40S ribosomal protein S25 n=1 Tax=Staphylotrichum longicolle TaxID=669026 RepID=A0AAD4I0L3_9PEZI|nr:40S ribosomal protein S25 [Staphylotrichum longicolle]
MAPAASGEEAEEEVVEGKSHAVILDKTTSDKLYKDVQSYRLVTVATLVDRQDQRLPRPEVPQDLEEKGQIKQVVGHSKMKIYSVAPAVLSNLAGGEGIRC